MTDKEASPVELMNDLYFGKLWVRVLPPGAVEIFGCLVLQGPSTRHEIDQYLRERVGTNEGLAAYAWDELHHYTDDELAAHRRDSPELYEGVDIQTAAEVMAEEAETRALQLSENVNYLTSMGLPAGPTLASVLDLLIACNVLLVDDIGQHTMNPAAPLPGEVLPLSAEEAIEQDEARWDRLYEQLTYGIIAIFNPEEQLVVELQLSLGDLAAKLSCDPESARQAVASLLTSGDFTASLDIFKVTEEQPFQLRVDWKRFNSDRITVIHDAPSDD